MIKYIIIGMAILGAAALLSSIVAVGLILYNLIFSL